MKAIQTIAAQIPVGHPDGEDRDLWVEFGTDEAGNTVRRSAWKPTDEELAVLNAGGHVDLLIWGPVQPPVAVVVDDTPEGYHPNAPTPLQFATARRHRESKLLSAHQGCDCNNCTTVNNWVNWVATNGGQA